MEDVLEDYHREYDDHTVVVCLDETSRQQTLETRLPLPVRQGQPAYNDDEYTRNGQSLHAVGVTAVMASCESH